MCIRDFFQKKKEVIDLYLLVMFQQIIWVKVGLVCSKQSYSQHILCSCFEALLFQETLLFSECFSFIAETFKWLIYP